MEKLKCVFCNTSTNDEFNLGQMLSKDNITVHYFCMLFSSNLVQLGEDDDQGILRFLPKDIKTEIARGSRLNCSYCKNKGATIGCSVKKCKITMHFPCGKRNKALFCSYGKFLSYCELHRPTQKVDAPNKNVDCPICYLSVENKVTTETLFPNCCKGAWFHRQCIQKQALNAGGYIFRCPWCNNKDDFQKEMHRYGIYVPYKDAAWELEENAYRELYDNYSQCDADNCQSTRGRKFNNHGNWQIFICTTCGSKGYHGVCFPQATRPRFECEDCSEISQRLKDMPPEQRAEKAALNNSMTSPFRPRASSSSGNNRQIQLMESLQSYRQESHFSWALQSTLENFFSRPNYQHEPVIVIEDDSSNDSFEVDIEGDFENPVADLIKDERFSKLNYDEQHIIRTLAITPHHSIENLEVLVQSKLDQFPPPAKKQCIETSDFNCTALKVKNTARKSFPDFQPMPFEQPKCDDQSKALQKQVCSEENDTVPKPLPETIEPEFPFEDSNEEPATDNFFLQPNEPSEPLQVIDLDADEDVVALT